MNIRQGLALVLVATVGWTAEVRAQTNPPAHGEILPTGGVFLNAPWTFKGWRDPFWPVGYQPTTGTPTQQVQRVNESAPIETVKKIEPLQWPEIRIKGITRAADGRCIALLAGAGLAEAGTVITLERDGFLFRWRVETVDDRGITYTRLDATPVEKRAEKKMEVRPVPKTARWDEDAAINMRGDTNSVITPVR
ncbi:MAG: hypothetical protein N2255_00090 [Kiritimatiellae bacterium]|nr:hypothetical protein [Kiritimatiellia bacterium]